MQFRYLLFVVWSHFTLAKVQFLGINIAGFEFGCLIDGTCPTGGVVPPLQSLGGPDGAGQMQHFVTDDKMNIFRLPVSWQYLTNNQLGGTLNPTNFGKFDQLVQECLKTGAHCVIDLHNFARFNGQIIGQGGPSDAQFADIWKQLATKYAATAKVVFGLMNEPHDLDVPIWANSAQAAVTAIRNAGAVSQMILLPGTNFNSAEFFVSSGSAAALSAIKNPDGSITGLVLELHKYLDIDNSGNHPDCTTDNTGSFATVVTFLRQNGRQAMVTETGAGSTPSCFIAFCAQNTFINRNSDVFIGLIAWAAGSFSTSYTLSLTPTKQNGKFVNNALAAQCVIAPWNSPANVATFVSGSAPISIAAPPRPSPSNGATAALTPIPQQANPLSSVASPQSTMGNEGRYPVSSLASKPSSGVQSYGNTTTSRSDASPTRGSAGGGSSTSPLRIEGTNAAGRMEVAGGIFFGALMGLVL